MINIRLPTGTFSYDPAAPLGPAGGFGQVFAGATAANVAVAVKKLHLSAADAAHRELDIAQELKGHALQHVIGFIDAGIDAESGDYFVVMPRAEYSLLAASKKTGKMDAATAASVLLQIANGLAEVPSIVHRDMKPGNVLWHEGKWKIADFGIARFVEETTSAQTLKHYLSQLYAAPEQWRFERATSATDIYALGCMAFEMLTGAPPFVTDPEKQHQTAPLPPFACSDSRLSGLIAVMVRKSASARPSIGRVQTVLREIVSGPLVAGGASLAQLVVAGTAIATAAQKAEAEKALAERAKRERSDLHREAQQILKENVGRLWEKIHLQVPMAKHSLTSVDPFNMGIGVGQAVLEIGRVRGTPISAGEFSHSGWDVVSSSTVSIKNGGRPYVWETSLWFVKRPNETDYRWLEVGYFAPFQHRSSPFSANGYREADLAASNITSGIQFAIGPAYIDDGQEAEFHERCLWLLARAAQGNLRAPGHLPIHAWPPQM